jgi:hypothetical protein
MANDRVVEIEAFRVSSSGLKYCKLTSAVHNSQRVTLNTQRNNKPNALLLQCSKMDYLLLGYGPVYFLTRIASEVQTLTH